MENFTKWQIIIINWLAAQVENNMLEFPNWKKVMQELNLHEKYDRDLYDDLKKWYADYCRNNQFPPQPKDLPEDLLVKSSGKSKIKTKTVYDQNKNKIIIVLPPNLKSNHLPFEEKIQQVLDYLRKNYKNQVPPSWTSTCQALGYAYKYELEARKPLKEWYISYRKEREKKWQEQNTSTNNTFLDLKTKVIQSVNVSVSFHDSEKNLKHMLVLIFNKIKEQVSNYKDIELNQYYQIFFEQFRSDVILTSCRINHSQRDSIIKKFHNVSNLKEFKNYLESSSGLYPKLALWTINNPFPIKAFEIEHHLIPLFLQNHQFELDQLEQPYNRVKINRIIHYLMHMVRLIEYGQPQDNNAVELMLRNQASNTPISWGSNLLQNTVKMMYDSLNTEMFKNYPQYEKQVTEKRKKQVLKLNLNKMSEKTKKVLTRKTVWRHKQNQGFEFTYYPQNLDNCSVDDFTRTIIEAYTQYQNSRNEPLYFNKNTNFITTREAFSKYMRGYTASVYNFYILNPPNFIKPF